MINSHTITTYTINDHPDKDAVYEYIRGNWDDLGQHYIEEAVDCLKSFAKYFDADLDYAVSLFPDRGEFISLKLNILSYNTDISELSGNRLRTYLVNNYTKIDECCPFTGVCYDETLLDSFRAFIKKPADQSFQDLLDDSGHNLLKDIHSEGEAIYSDEGIHELLEINKYEFLESGDFYS